MNAREIVLTMCLKINEDKLPSHVVINETLKNYKDLSKQDRAFISRLCLGVLEQKLRLDYDLERFSKIKVKKMKPVIRNVLRIAAYQIEFMEQIPDSAACDEAVKLVKKRGLGGLSGFVNGILRNLSREFQKANGFDISKLNEIERLSYQYSMPKELVEFWLKSFRREQVEEMLQAFLEPKDTSIRINESKITIDELVDNLVKDGVEVRDGAYLTNAKRITSYNSLPVLDSFQKGYFQVQDESSMMVGLIAGIKAGDYIIDVCAAPGGKTLHAADLLLVAGGEKNPGHVDARDKTDRKVALIEQNLERIGYQNVSVKVFDALVPDDSVKEKADIILADLPCSGLGVIGKKPDIKYNMTKEMMSELAKLQRNILTVVVSYLKPGGVLIFSTCTINPEENEDNIRFITETLKLQPESIDTYLPENLQCETSKQGYLQLLPNKSGVDGFFISRFRKV
ncbi:16S rRNA (cytosine(967)-C(5))-methyltransferase RsmB [Lachnoclostridium phytofermentans]|uniref:16S rRNA (cytosine(967)-C(5))-methyltransferase n=1 Tax=Lachnoclostridium phytofermentans (strain ATCC 700394 / DSM 18823 / ISDg) TaxID=357809 RepID=A9KM96_LACP7|nr:16S rRNA (cytosine(967)-C(5))-methyltransferase RsmB [Lachnoclostridium phytofermentans]ABX42850.1 sun protein [Lachnoclostridium phytofermentans ISDg]